MIFYCLNSVVVLVIYYIMFLKYEKGFNRNDSGFFTENFLRISLVNAKIDTVGNIIDVLWMQYFTKRLRINLALCKWAKLEMIWSVFYDSWFVFFSYRNQFDSSSVLNIVKCPRATTYYILSQIAFYAIKKY